MSESTSTVVQTVVDGALEKTVQQEKNRSQPCNSQDHNVSASRATPAVR
jgi:hypothetical protein